jgi:short subunit dehydrogenase-like uncharacterized protein
MSHPLLLYGATGFTARLITEVLVQTGHRPILCARNGPELQRVAEHFGLECRAVGLDDEEALLRAFENSEVVLNAAGPFVQTAGPVLRACLGVGAHYLDISGEVLALDELSHHHERARRAGIMILPGIGFDVVPSDCLCAHVAARAGRVSTLRIAISGLELLSPGSAKTISAELGQPTRVRYGGYLRELTPGTLNRTFDFGRGGRPCTAVTWGDLVTAHYTTGADNIETYFELTPAIASVVQANRYLGWLYRTPAVRAGIERSASWWSSPPSPEQRASRRAAIVVEAEHDGGRVASRLTTPEAYTLTAVTATAIAGRVLGGTVEPGFQSPARLLGADFIMNFAEITREDL